MPNINEIPQFIGTRCNYEVDVGWNYFDDFLETSLGDCEVHLNPDFQRGHVWTNLQQQRYIEYVLRGGRCAKDLIFASEGFSSSGTNPVYLVDGLQRLTAIQGFLKDKVPAFGYYYSEYDGRLRSTHHRFHVRVLDIGRKDILQLYLDLNAGGTPHTEAEIERVRKMLAKES